MSDQDTVYWVSFIATLAAQCNRKHHVSEKVSELCLRFCFRQSYDELQNFASCPSDCLMSIIHWDEHTDLFKVVKME